MCLVWTAFRREEKAPSVQISIKTIIDDATTTGNQRSVHQQKRINKSKNRHHQQIKTNVGKVCVSVCVWVDECAKKEPINGFTYKLQIIQFLPFITHSTAPLIYHGNSLSKSLSTPPHTAYGYDACDALRREELHHQQQTINTSYVCDPIWVKFKGVLHKLLYTFYCVVKQDNIVKETSTAD